MRPGGPKVGVVTRFGREILTLRLAHTRGCGFDGRRRRTLRVAGVVRLGSAGALGARHGGLRNNSTFRARRSRLYSDTSIR
jgi:hypothetical protein